MLVVDIILRWFALLSLSSETQQIMKRAGSLLQNAVHYNKDGETELVIVYKKAKYQMKITEKSYPVDYNKLWDTKLKEQNAEPLNVMIPATVKLEDNVEAPVIKEDL